MLVPEKPLIDERVQGLFSEYPGLMNGSCHDVIPPNFDLLRELIVARRIRNLHLCTPDEQTDYEISPDALRNAHVSANRTISPRSGCTIFTVWNIIFY